MYGSSTLVSVVIPAYNSGKFVQEAVLSVINQTHRNTEILVVDDGSTDETGEILLPFVQNGLVSYIYQANSGPASARNLGVRLARGEFIAFLDADDQWLPDKLQKQLGLFRKPAVGMVYSDGETFIQEGDNVEDLGFIDRVEPRLSYRRGRVYDQLLRSNFVSTSSVVVKSEVLKRAGLFLETVGEHRFSYGEDYELWLRLSRVCEVDFVDEKLVMFRLHKNSLSNDKLRGYTQLYLLYKYLLLQKGSSNRPTIAQKYAEYAVKSKIASLFRIK